MRKIIILIPVYNDWDSLIKLMDEKYTKDSMCTSKFRIEFIQKKRMDFHFHHKARRQNPIHSRDQRRSDKLSSQPIRGLLGPLHGSYTPRRRKLPEQLLS